MSETSPTYRKVSHRLGWMHLGKEDSDNLETRKRSGIDFVEYVLSSTKVGTVT